MIDNAPIQMNRLVKELWDVNQVFVVTIWPYAPSLNPWVKVIAVINEKVKIIESEGRLAD